MPHKRPGGQILRIQFQRPLKVNDRLLMVPSYAVVIPCSHSKKFRCETRFVKDVVSPYLLHNMFPVDIC